MDCDNKILKWNALLVYHLAYMLQIFKQLNFIRLIKYYIYVGNNRVAHATRKRCDTLHQIQKHFFFSADFWKNNICDI